MGVEASRRALAALDGPPPEDLFFATPAPAYLDKTNATAIHGALELPPWAGAYDMVGSVRSSVGALRAASAVAGDHRAVAVLSDLRTGMAGGPEERDSGDGAVAVVFGGPDDAVVAEWVAHAGHDRRVPRPVADAGGVRLQGVGGAVRPGGLRAAGPPGLGRRPEVGAAWWPPTSTTWRWSVCTPGPSAPSGVRSASGPTPLAGRPGDHGREPGRGRAGRRPGRPAGAGRARGPARPGRRGRRGRRGAPAHHRCAGRGPSEPGGRPGWPRWPNWRRRAGGDVPYPRFLTWRGELLREPPRRPDPERPGAPATWRSTPWKGGFEASDCRACGFRHLPPARVCLRCRTIDEMDRVRLADVGGRVATFTIDRLAFSLSPPVIGAVVDFDGGGRYRCEMTDADPDAVSGSAPGWR